MELTVETREVGDVTVAAVRGEIDVYTAPALRQRLQELLDRGARQLAVDLGEVSFLDSTGLGVLVGVHRRAVEAGGRLDLVAPQPMVLRVLEITGLAKVFAVHGSLPDAGGHPVGGADPHGPAPVGETRA